MPFINNKQYKEILAAKHDGNPKAIAVIDKYLHNGSQDDLDRLVHDFYGEPEKEVMDVVEISEPVIKEVLPVQEDPVVAEPTPDITEVLNGEIDGLFDNEEIPELSFEDFLKEKKKNCMRAKKNADYFKAFDFDGRQKYLGEKKDEFNKSFDLKRRDIDRNFVDMDKAISLYAQNVGDLPEDDVKLDTNVSGNAYDEIVDIGGKSHSFGRSWDEMDNEEIRGALTELVSKYGKKNVQAALNIIKGDNAAYRDHRNNAIDVAVGKYNKNLEGILK